MSDLRYPEDTICAVETCGHLNREHQGNCGRCLTNRGRGFTIENPSHGFKPLMRGGICVTPGMENTMYERAMRGDPIAPSTPAILPEDGLFA